MRDAANHRPGDGKFVAGNKAATGRRRSTCPSMREFREVIRKATKKADMAEIWLKVLEQAKKGSYPFVNLVMSYTCGKAEDLELDERVAQLEQLLESQNPIGRVG